MRKYSTFMSFILLISFLAFSLPINAQASTYSVGDYTFPQGQKSFADQVVSYSPGSPGPKPKFRNSQAAIGLPDYVKRDNSGFVSLGCQGSLVLKFSDNSLSNGPGADLIIYEVGSKVEATEVEISENGNDWLSIGVVKGKNNILDLAGLAPDNKNFYFVKLTDVSKKNCKDKTAGADIDAVATLNPALLTSSRQIAGGSAGTVYDPYGCGTNSDRDGDGVKAIACGGSDCDDSDPNRFPGNLEVADQFGHDEDCDATTIGGRDQDKDGFIDISVTNPDGRGGVISGDDCDDSKANVNPLASEVCDGIDNNCDGKIDEGVTSEFFLDADRDLFGDPKHRREACGFSEYFDGKHWVRNKEDCDDSDPQKNPITGNCQ